ncbi:MAG: metalloregulator ArsR/SmtB family transcription factor [Hyphomicrobiales bacterium]|jgi:protein-tyrosine-phosphatase/DNA-binding transcriptional ArsR family regulator|nr:metalloregulator ArsR/SmtB family transcription factor [Hyphomicrobiales bacterium]
MTGRLHADRMVAQLQALAQPSRLAAMRVLARHRPFGLPAGDIARLVAVPHNTMSTHLATLEDAGLVRSRREGRSIIYAAEPNACALLAGQLTADLDPPAKRGVRAASLPVRSEAAETVKPWRVLVLCTRNSARSLMAEALINREGRGRFQAVSAGSRPGPDPNPNAIRLLADLGYPTTALAAKGWAGFAEPGAEPIDFVITVCDQAAGEPCPAWTGHPLAAHWGIADPVEAGASEAEERAALLAAYRQLSQRVTAFVNLPIANMDLATLKRELAIIGCMDGATPMALAGDAA